MGHLVAECYHAIAVAWGKLRTSWQVLKNISKSIGNSSEGNYFDEAEAGQFSVLKDII